MVVSFEPVFPKCFYGFCLFFIFHLMVVSFEPVFPKCFYGFCLFWLDALTLVHWFFHLTVVPFRTVFFMYGLAKLSLPFNFRI